MSTIIQHAGKMLRVADSGAELDIEPVRWDIWDAMCFFCFFCPGCPCRCAGSFAGVWSLSAASSPILEARASRLGLDKSRFATSGLTSTRCSSCYNSSGMQCHCHWPGRWAGSCSSVDYQVIITNL